MKIRVIKVADQVFTYDGQDEATLRQALLHERGVPAIVYDITDLDRSDMDGDEYLTVTEDDGTPVWSGWLGGVTGPPPLDRDALAALAADWTEELDEGTVTQAEHVEQLARNACARQLLAAIGQPS